MSVKGRRIAVPPFSEVSSLKPNISKREIGVRFNGRTVPNLPTYRQIILQGHFQLFLLDSSHQPEPLCKVSKLTFLFNEIDILLLGLIYMRKTEKSSTKFKLFFLYLFFCFLFNISITVRRSFPSARSFNFSFLRRYNFGQNWNQVSKQRLILLVKQLLLLLKNLPLQRLN